MDLLKQLFVAGSIACTLPAMAQISSGKTDEKPVAKEEKPVTARREPTDGLNEFSLYLGAGRVWANRSLAENKAPFGAPLGFRSDEYGLKTWSFQAGARNRVSKYLSYDVGLSLDRFGESYSYDDRDSDSSYKYTNRYTYIAMPVQVLFTTGKDLRLFVGGGVQPELLAGYRQEVKWETSLAATGSETNKNTNGMNGFGMAALATCGVQMRWSSHASIYVIPSWMWGLTSTYDDQSDYIHKGRSFTLKFGVVMHLDQ